MMPLNKSFARTLLGQAVMLAVLETAGKSWAQAQPAGDAARGRAYFQISCAICHSDALGPNNTVIHKQGPSLVGVVGRVAASSPHFNYSTALHNSGLVWDAATLNRFVANPMVAVPGTAMPMPVPNDASRADVIAYLLSDQGHAITGEVIHIENR